MAEEPEEWLTSTDMMLDRYIADLNLRVADDGAKGTPISVEGFAYMWTGVKSNYGFKAGKIAFEVKLEDKLDVHLPEDEEHKHIIRVGLSATNTSTQLGEEALSYGFDGTGKKAADNKFEDYGETLDQGDVVGCYMDFESDPKQMSFTKNGEDLGVCFEGEALGELGESVLFPSILTKNIEYTINFGQLENPHFPLKEGYVFVNTIPLEERVRGPVPPEKRENCEMIMMVGLPGAGKTTWAAKCVKENPEKNYNLLGTNTIIDKMKVMGEPRKGNFAGRWDTIIDKSTKCLIRLLEIACRKKRNYILDQTNVYPSAQRRKMRPFEGFLRKAVVICPSDEDLTTRTEKRENEEGKEIPDSAILDMKANYTLPEEGQSFTEVEFVELAREEAQELIDRYNKEAQALLPPQDEGRRGGWNDGGGHRGGWGNRGDFGRGGYGRGGGGGWNQGMGHRGGGWNQGGGNRFQPYGGGPRGGYGDGWGRGGRGGGGYGGGGYGGGRGGGYGGGRGDRGRDNRDRDGGGRHGDRDNRRGGGYDRRGGGDKGGYNQDKGNGYNSYDKNGSSSAATQQKDGGQGGNRNSGGNSYNQSQGSWGNGQSQGYQQNQGWGQQGWGQQGWGQQQQGWNQQQGYWGQQGQAATAGTASTTAKTGSTASTTQKDTTAATGTTAAGQAASWAGWGAQAGANGASQQSNAQQWAAWNQQYTAQQQQSNAEAWKQYYAQQGYYQQQAAGTPSTAASNAQAAAAATNTGASK